MPSHATIKTYLIYRSDHTFVTGDYCKWSI